MRPIFSLGLLVAASASAQTVNTQVTGLTLTNGLSSVSDASGLGPFPEAPTGVGFLTDGDTSTFAFNLGNSGGGAIQGSFSGGISSSSTGIYFVSIASSFSGSPIVVRSGPTFSLQLALAGGLSAARTYGDADFTITNQKIQNLSFYSGTGVGGSSATVVMNIDPEVQWNTPYYYAYLHVPFTDFGVTPGQVLGLRLGDFTSQHPDIGFIGAGYAGAPVPEPSTYGLILGGLALAGAALRRRRR